MTYEEVMRKLESLASHDPKDLAGMARFGINVDKAWVISIPKLRTLAKEIRGGVTLSGTKGPGFGVLDSSCGQNDDGLRELHELALQVWDSGIHEAKILAGFIDNPKLVTSDQMEKWALGFDSWDVTDMICGNLFDRTSFAVQKAVEWSARPEEFVKRAGFVLMAGLGVHNKTMPDEQFMEFLEIIKRESGDNRNFVRKAVNWALRTIGKSRNERLYQAAIKTCEEILRDYSSSPFDFAQDKLREKFSTRPNNKEAERAARFIAGDAIRELQKDYIKNRFTTPGVV